MEKNITAEERLEELSKAIEKKEASLVKLIQKLADLSEEHQKLKRQVRNTRSYIKDLRKDVDALKEEREILLLEVHCAAQRAEVMNMVDGLLSGELDEGSIKEKLQPKG